MKNDPREELLGRLERRLAAVRAMQANGPRVGLGDAAQEALDVLKRARHDPTYAETAVGEAYQLLGLGLRPVVLSKEEESLERRISDLRGSILKSRELRNQTNGDRGQ